MKPATVVGVLALLLGLQPVTTDLYLPALPTLTADLGADLGAAQLTLTALLLAFGASQLVWGPLSDRFGRKPILLGGLALYLVAGLACALAPGMAWLIAGRTVQGVGLGAAVMGARAITRDLYAPAEGARILSRAYTGLGVIACICPLAGGWLTEAWHWRAAVGVLVVFAAGTLLAVALAFEESAPPPRLDALRPAALLRTWRQIVRHPTFVAYSALSITSYDGLFTFLAASSFVFTGVLGLSRAAYGTCVFTMALAYVAGTFLCRALLARLGVRRTVAVAGGLSLLGGLAMLALAEAGVRSPWAILLPLYPFMLGHGIHQPCGQSGAVGPFPQAAGAASALNGFLMMVAAFGMGGWLGTHLGADVTALTHGMAFWSVLIALSAWTLVQRHGAPAAAPEAAR